MTSTGPGAPGTPPKTSDDAVVDPMPVGPAEPADLPLPGTGRRARTGHVISYGPGRPCSTAGCTTPLSIYNSGGSCALHSRPVGRGEGEAGPADLLGGPGQPRT